MGLGEYGAYTQSGQGHGSQVGFPGLRATVGESMAPMCPRTTCRRMKVLSVGKMSRCDVMTGRCEPLWQDSANGAAAKRFEDGECGTPDDRKC